MGPILSGISFAVGFTFVGLFFYSLSKHKNRVSKLFSLVSLAMAIYVIGYAFELRSQSLEWIGFFLKVQYFGLPFLFVFWLMLLYKVCLNRDPSLKLTIALMVIPVLTLFLAVTNDFHHLYYADISVVQHDGFVTAKLTKGPWYVLHAVYSYGTLLVGVGLAYKAWRRSACTKMQSVLLTIGVLVPGIIEIAYFAGLSPYGLDLTPFSASVFAVCYYVALFRFDLFELDDIAWSSLFSELEEGIIVVDHRNRLLNFNSAASKVFDWLNLKNIGTYLPSIPEAHIVTDHEKDLFTEADAEGGADGAHTCLFGHRSQSCVVPIAPV